jgi:hypothetical protein
MFIHLQSIALPNYQQPSKLLPLLKIQAKNNPDSSARVTDMTLDDSVRIATVLSRREET